MPLIRIRFNRPHAYPMKIQELQVQSAKHPTDSRLRTDQEQRPQSVGLAWHAKHETDQRVRQGDHVLIDLVNELSAKLTSISSSLGACQLSLGGDATDDASLGRVHFALKTANEGLGQAKQIARSVKGFASSYAGLNRHQMTLNAVFDQVLQIIGPRLQSAAVRVQTEVHCNGAVVIDSARFVLALVSLIDAMVEEFEDANDTSRLIKIQSVAQAGTLEIVVSGLASVTSPLPTYAASEPVSVPQGPDQRPNCFDSRRSEIASWLSHELQGNVFVTRTSRNEPAYRILLSINPTDNRSDSPSSVVRHDRIDALNIGPSEGSD